MKYNDYKNHYDRHIEIVRAQMDANKGLHAELNTIGDSCSRTYTLGMSVEMPYTPSNVVSVYISCHNEQPAIYVNLGDRIRPSDFGMFTALQLNKLAEIRRAVAQWMMGEIDELPPNGEWPTTK